MSFKTKLTTLLLIGVAAWQVSLTGSEKMTLACGIGVPQPCKQADSARSTLYWMAVGGTLGIVFRKDKKA